LFLLIGAMLFVFHHGAEAAGSADRIFPSFIVQQLPHGVSGILIAAILAAAMSNLSAALNSLSSTSMVDFYLRRRPEVEEKERLRISRWATVGWAVVLFGLAVLLRTAGHVVEEGLAIASVAYGALLGVFLLGVLTKRATESGAMVGMASGFAVELYVALGTKVPWTWYVMIGSVVTFAVGYGASILARPRHNSSSAD
jgi:Na+/proline symporter